MIVNQNKFKKNLNSFLSTILYKSNKNELFYNLKDILKSEYIASNVIVNAPLIKNDRMTYKVFDDDNEPIYHLKKGLTSGVRRGNVWEI